jgi:hypothetical protein
LIAEGDKLALGVTVHRGTMAAGHPQPMGRIFRIETGRVAEIWEPEWHHDRASW